jgi:hypothetical protein
MQVQWSRLQQETQRSEESRYDHHLHGVLQNGQSPASNY